MPRESAKHAAMTVIDFTYTILTILTILFCYCFEMRVEKKRKRAEEKRTRYL
jgi:hypothetical protein